MKYVKCDVCDTLYCDLCKYTKFVCLDGRWRHKNIHKCLDILSMDLYHAQDHVRWLKVQLKRFRE